MTSSKRRRAFTARQRQDYLAEFERSGLSAATFCRREKLHPATFSLWRRTTKPAAAGFAEVQVSAPTPTMAASGGAAVLLLPQGARLEVALGNDAAWHGLGLLLKSLQSESR